MAWLKSTPSQYAALAKWLHWLSAVAVVGLFALGLWMVDLSYYHQWYVTAPELHVSIGICLGLLTLLRLLHRTLYPYPPAIAGGGRGQVIAAKAAHISLYLLLLALLVSGYFIVTAEGEPLSVFGMVHLPALLNSDDNLQDSAGRLHEWLAYAVMVLAAVHSAAALYHHFVIRDNTLRRMVTRAKTP